MSNDSEWKPVCECGKVLDEHVDADPCRETFRQQVEAHRQWLREMSKIPIAEQLRNAPLIWSVEDEK